MARIRVLSQTIAFVALSSTAFAQSGGPSAEAERLKALHPFKLISLPGYAGAWKTMTSQPALRRDDYWIREPGGPGAIKTGRTDDGKEVSVGNLCKQHDCHDYNFEFVIDPATKAMWGLKRTRGDAPKSQTFYGRPSATMQHYLAQQMRQEFPDP